MTFKCIIVDDEPLSHEVLENYIQKLPVLELVSSFFNAIDALTYLNTHEVDLIFLDINMPELSGIGMLKSLQNPPSVIFTSAYPEYAVDGFDLDIADFLLKPYSFERFLKAVNKFNTSASMGNGNPQEIITLKTDKKLYRIKLTDIIYIESAGDYAKIHTPEKVIVVNQTLKHFEQILPVEYFVRVHRSFIIAIGSINYIQGNQLVISDAQIPIGQSYKDVLLLRLA